METKITLGQIKKLIPTNVILSYVDYRENLSDSLDLLQECISVNCWDKLYESLDDYLCESQREGIESYKEELKNNVEVKFNLDEDKAYRLVYETYKDEIEEILYQKDKSDTVKDLLRNTKKFSLFIDTGLHIEEGSWHWSRSEQTGWLKKIKRKLKIESNEWDKNIRQMLSEASYGGQLVIYFYASVEKLVTDDKEKDFKSILFFNPAIAIINTNCGSGDHTFLQGHSFTTSFSRENLFIDRYFKYNYVAEVCGMSQDWCKDVFTKFSFDLVKGRKNASSPLAAEALQDREYALTYQQGKCTALDMDMNRHRDTYYINNYPCGVKCPHCGTFWID